MGFNEVANSGFVYRSSRVVAEGDMKRGRDSSVSTVKQNTQAPRSVPWRRSLRNARNATTASNKTKRDPSSSVISVAAQEVPTWRAYTDTSNHRRSEGRLASQDVRIRAEF